ncbi:MAG: serine hydrolase domain-containing protein [Promethearchaeota archaeon]
MLQQLALVRKIKVRILLLTVVIAFGMFLFSIMSLPISFTLYNADLSITRSRIQVLTKSYGLTSDQSLDEDIIQLMQTGYIPSVAASIIKNDSIMWVKSFGEQSSIDTIFMIASITKTFTATAILQLYEQGFFNLDDDVNNYLPFSLRNPNHPNIPITFRMLLSHTASINGSQDDYWGVTFQDLYRKLGLLNDTETFPSYPTWLEEYFAPNGSLYTSNVWKIEAPGSSSHATYANPGFDLLGYLIELISNKTLDQYFLDNIFAPLNMNSTGFNLSGFEQEKLAIPHYWNDTDGNIAVYPLYNCLAFGAGALRTTITDLSHFLIAQMQGGYYNGIRILKEETVELMHDCTHSNLGNGYGFGWSLDINPQWQGHNGGGPGIRTQMYFRYTETNPALPIGVIVLGNQGWVPGEAAGEAIGSIRDRLYEEALIMLTTTSELPTTTTSELPITTTSELPTTTTTKNTTVITSKEGITTSSKDIINGKIIPSFLIFTNILAFFGIVIWRKRRK